MNAARLDMQFPDGKQLAAHPKTYTSRRVLRNRQKQVVDLGVYPDHVTMSPNTCDLHISDFTASEMQQLVRAYQTYRAQFTKSWPVRTRLMPGHTCSGSCQMIQCEENVFVCVASGNLHMCTNILCRRMLVNDNTEVCELTMRSIPIESSYRIGVIHNACSERDAPQEEPQKDFKIPENETDEARRIRLSFLALKHISGRISSEEEVQLKSESPLGKRKRDQPEEAAEEEIELDAPVCVPPKAVIAPVQVRKPKKEKVLRLCKVSNLKDEEQRRRRVVLYGTVIKTALTDPTCVPRVKLCLSLLLESLWKLVVSSPVYSHHSMTYRPRYHCLVMLYLAKQGLTLVSPQRIQLIPKVAWLTGLLPKRGTVPGFKTNHITKTQKLFNEMLSCCYTQDILRCAREIEAVGIPSRI